MDYKQIVELVRWHAVYSDLSGSEWALITFMAAESNHRTSRIKIGHAELAEALGMSKASATKSIRSLEQKQAITVVEKAIGRAVATYKIRTADELTDFFAVEQKNPELEVWYSTHLDMGRTHRRNDVMCAIEDECEDCAEARAERGLKMCERHGYLLAQVEASPAWRAHQLWLADNPEPPAKIKTIHGRPIHERS